MTARIWMSLLLWACACSVVSADKPTDDRDAAGAPDKAEAPAPLEGHSAHGEVFNEGPRQKAYLMNTCGPVEFEATAKSDEAAKFVDQGLNQLHGFWYFEAERSFRQAAAIDEDCAMAYLGMALSNLRNQKRAEGFIKEAVERKDNASDREKLYIDAYKAYVEAAKDKEKRKARVKKLIKALDNIAVKHPDDLEAKAQLALQLYLNRSGDGSSYLAANALLDEILRIEPLHPVHHYKIHLWDHKDPARALESAGLCGPSAPGIAHMWHMPGHIYSRLKRYHDAVYQQEASARVDHAQMMRDRLLPDQIHNFAHNNEWLIRNLIHIGKAPAAISLAKNMIELPRHPKYNTLNKRGCSASYGRQRLIDVLRKFEMWEEVVGLAQTPYLEPTDSAEHQTARLRILGAALQGLGDRERLEKEWKAAENRLAEIEARMAQAEQKAVAKELSEWKSSDRPPRPLNSKEKARIKKAKRSATRSMADDLRHWRNAVHELSGRLKICDGKPDLGLAELRKAEGLWAVELARLEFEAGEQDKALKSIAAEVKSHQKEVLPLACQVELLWRAGKDDEARKAWYALRGMSSEIDIRRRPFARLRPILKSWDVKDQDWRAVADVPSDLGPRPELDTLGPFRWRPFTAPEWEATLGDNSPIHSKQFEGRPYVMVFYLGFGCLHCAEQLHKFAPRMDDLRAQGLELVAISSDNVDGLRKSQEDYSGGELPFPIASDERLDLFRAYRAFDDFEQTPLHGTFLIDGRGQVRWQDISYEPFMDVDFLLKESARLLESDS